MAMSRKGPWNLSRTLATQAGMTNKWLKAQGVPSIKEMWESLKAKQFREYRRQQPLAVCYRCGAKYISEINE